MRKTLLVAATAFVIGGASIGSLMSYAQPAPPPASDERPAMEQHGMDGQDADHHRPMAWMHHWREHQGREHQEREHHWPIRPGTFALLYPQTDRALTPPDVQKIAEAFLLWHGNHSWKVTNVAATADGAIGFALATQDGSVIAQFTMDLHTGRVTRTG
jgi:hypothetical protein